MKYPVSTLITFIVISSTLASSFYPISKSHNSILPFEFWPPSIFRATSTTPELASYSVFDLTKHVFDKIDWRTTFMKMLRVVVDHIVDIVFEIAFAEKDALLEESSSRSFERRSGRQRTFTNECSILHCVLREYLQDYRDTIRRMKNVFPKEFIQKRKVRRCSCS